MRVLSLFSGAGGMDLGFQRAGHEIVWANDFDRNAVETYRANLGGQIVCGDIRDVHLQDLPDAEIVVGGFPCQGFSRANMLRSAGDERNNLYREFLRVVKGKKPDYFVAENVAGILSLDKGSAVLKILADFRAAGYDVEHKLINMANYGVPQLRRRVIFLGCRKGIPLHLRPGFPSPTHAEKPSGKLKPWVTIAQALKGIPEPDAQHRLLNHICSKYKVTNRDFTGHRPTNPDRPSPTILARGNGKGGVCAIHHPSNLRRLSIRESALIQTFPKSFEFHGALGSMYRQVGNAVPVLFAAQLGKQFADIECWLETEKIA
jgi:DNA (cytosine-5)-methyltransferase 1